MKRWRIRGYSKSGNSFALTVRADDYAEAKRKAGWYAVHATITDIVLIDE